MTSYWYEFTRKDVDGKVEIRYIRKDGSESDAIVFESMEKLEDALLRNGLTSMLETVRPGLFFRCDPKDLHGLGFPEGSEHDARGLPSSIYGLSPD